MLEEPFRELISQIFVKFMLKNILQTNNCRFQESLLVSNGFFSKLVGKSFVTAIHRLYTYYLYTFLHIIYTSITPRRKNGIAIIMTIKKKLLKYLYIFQHKPTYFFLKIKKNIFKIINGSTVICLI